MRGTGLLKPCLDCGLPSPGPRCAAHTDWTKSSRRRELRKEYDRAAWRALSKRARAMQSVCLEPGEHSGPLAVHHTAVAWQRRGRGLPIRLQDVRVMCARHNSELGPMRPVT